MADKTVSLAGMPAPEAAARETQQRRTSSFDPPRYFTTVHVPGYNVLTSIAAARHRQRRRATVKDLRKQSSRSPGEPFKDPVASTEANAGAGPPAGSRHAD